MSNPAFAALGGAAPSLCRHWCAGAWQSSDVGLSLDVPFLAFVLALGLVVKAVSLHGLSSLVVHLMPNGTSLGSLLVTAAVVAAVLANMINNLPAVLLLLPAAAAAGPAQCSQCSSASIPGPTSPM